MEQCLTTQLKTYGFNRPYIKNVPSDGSCFFHCLSFIYFKRYDYDGSVRNELVDGLQESLGDEYDEGYMQNMRKSNTWADGFIVRHAVQQAFREMGVFVFEYSTETGALKIFCGGEPTSVRGVNAVIVNYDDMHFKCVLPERVSVSSRRWFMMAEMPEQRRDRTDEEIDRIIT